MEIPFEQSAVLRLEGNYCEEESGFEVRKEISAMPSRR
jgi:hypothetical protein